MIKNIMITILLILVAYLSQDYFSTTLPTQEKPEVPEKKLSESSIQKQLDSVEKVSYHKPMKQQQINTYNEKMTLDALLLQHKFYDALTFYLDNSSNVNMKKIETYLATLAKNKPTLALEYMHVFLDNESESSVGKLMIETYIEQNEFAKAIKYIIETKESYVSEHEDKRLHAQLIQVSKKYIDRLMDREEFGLLIAFLEEMIAYDDAQSFYSFKLAQVFMGLDKTEEASVLLHTLQYDDTYEQNAKKLLETIEKNEEESYDYSIPLEKRGAHYVVTVILDGTSFNLLLDTGATYIFIDEDKASMLEVIRDDLVLQTAGNDINAKLSKASSMRVGDLELSNIKVTVAPFKREGVDGLLGMNFLKKFNFYIDQDKHTLHLNAK
ncbi:MAG: retropepsin-like aspartic protease [Campylobacterota bacterium]|nr:retropepsin-like aspartic protease [Campylobacterota bacterium]